AKAGRSGDLLPCGGDVRQDRGGREGTQISGEDRMMATIIASPNQSTPRRVPAGRLVVYGVVLAVGLCLMFAPFLFPDVRAQEVAARICVFIVLVASYDLLIGYTGIVSFAHTMFFGLGAYGVAIALKTMGAGFDAILLGGSLGVIAALVLAVL